MEIDERIRKLKLEHLKRIEEAARKGDTEVILRSAAIVEQIESVEQKVDEARNRLVALEDNKLMPVENRRMRAMRDTGRDNGEGLSYKALGKQRRQQFLEDAAKKGIVLDREKGVRFRKDGKLIGIASASERIANRWFLGLPPDKYDSAVLLCETTKGDCIRFILGKDIYSGIEKLLTRDENGQLKFNVSKEFQHYFLKIPGRQEVNITRCIENFDSLRF